MSISILEDMRRALLHVLVEEIGSSFERSQERERSQKRDVSAMSEEELEPLLGETVSKARRRNVRRDRG